MTRMSRVTSKAIVLAVALVTATAAMSSAQVSASTDASGPVLVTSYRMVNIYTNPGTWVDYNHRTAYCDAGAGGTCSITHETAISTSVTVSLGATQSWAAGEIGFSLSRSNSTSVTCTSPVLKAGQIYASYRPGTRKSYQIQKWQNWLGEAPHLVSTSGYLEAFQPYTTGISCRVE